MRRVAIFMLALVFVATALIIRLSTHYGSAFDTYVELSIKGDIGRRINAIVFTTVSENEAEFNNLVLTQIDNGKISSISVDTRTISLLATEISDKIYCSINEAKNTFGLPLGNVVGSKIFSGKGPKIDVKVIPVGAVRYNIESELKSGGINQTLHRVRLVFQTEVKCTAPFDECEVMLETSIVLAETLIVGDVPEIILPSVVEFSGTFEGDN